MKKVSLFALTHNNQVWGYGETPELAKLAAHKESQEMAREVGESRETIEEDPIVTGGLLIEVSCGGRKEDLIDLIKNWS